MKHIVVDLEMNGMKRTSDVSAICLYETIEIGAVMLDENFQEVSSFRTYVKPEYNDCITPAVNRLTGISYDMVAYAPLFSEALRMFTNWCLGTGDEFVIYAWSESDFCQIKNEMELKQYKISDEEIPALMVEWHDFQHEFDDRLGFLKQSSLKNALNMAGLVFEGREHDALDDAKNTAELLTLFKDKELFDTTLRKIEEVMKPKESGISLGSLIDFSKFKVG